MTPKPAARKAVPPPHPRSPDHRWIRAHTIVDDYDSGGRIDRPTLFAVEYLQRHLAQRSIPSDLPMSAALKLYRDSEPIAWKLEALLLARGQSGSSIAHRLKLPFPVVKLYRSIFYDARSWRRRRVSGLDLFNVPPMLGFPEEALAGC